MKRVVNWSGLLIYTLLVAATLWLRHVNGVATAMEIVSQIVSSLALVGAGFFILWRRPGNAIGRIFIVVATSIMFWNFADEYARHALLVRPGRLPFGTALAWASLWSWTIHVWPILIFLPLLYPDGRLPTPRWRPVAWLGGATMVAMILIVAFSPGMMEGLEPYENPLGIGKNADVWERLETAVMLLFIPVNLLATLSLIVRFRQSKSEQRAQIKWFLYVTLLLLLHAAYGVSFEVGIVPKIPTDFSSLLFSTLVAAFALALAVAILKHRLYDIDLLIRRTLQYALLTGLLALIYFGSIALLQSVVLGIAGEHSAVVIVLSTLLTAALFQPLRGRLQTTIDRRFFRQKVDPQQVLARFAQAARDEVALEALETELLTTVRQALQPESAALWLLESASRSLEDRRAAF